MQTFGIALVVTGILSFFTIYNLYFAMADANIKFIKKGEYENNDKNGKS
jgi:hypothetical protein